MSSAADSEIVDREYAVLCFDVTSLDRQAPCPVSVQRHRAWAEVLDTRHRHVLREPDHATVFGWRTSRSPRTAPSGSRPKGSSSPSMARSGRPTTRQQAGRPLRSRPVARSGRSGGTRSKRTRPSSDTATRTDGSPSTTSTTPTACTSRAPTISGPPVDGRGIPRCISIGSGTALGRWPRRPCPIRTATRPQTRLSSSA